MFGNYFGQYLMEQGSLTADQLQDVLQAQKSARVKLGLLAVASGLLTQKQADEVNRLQQQKDMRFGDIAVEKGYLTPAQVSEMLSRQGDDYMTFVQAMTDKGVMELPAIEEQVAAFATARGYSDEEMQALKSGDLDAIVPIFLQHPSLTPLHKSYIALLMRNVMRFLDSDIRMEPVTPAVPMELGYGVQQDIFGDQKLVTAIFGDEQVILDMASTYGKEDFASVDADSLDALGEFLNVSNGLFVSAKSEEKLELDLEPPVMYPEKKSLTGDTAAYVVPIYLSGRRVSVVLSIDAQVELA